ncbi:MAG: bifunctional 5,10-methylenetetrahydrofolate dehydrogenase/5,10-methenyltetrahydrofolate cyclohydrolase [Candidatus Omnitrophica bacterium]|nr:bifunctional 5,10-methylenetetrahydrofolate dehydrogenase/5,10-methenyltetrahydrofolate cyclohydrolase [Candidatus Omnitrophota bacterium]
MDKFIDGRKISESILSDLAAKFTAISGRVGRPARLVSFMAGKDKNAEIYVKVQERVASKIRIDFGIERLSSEAKEKDVLEVIEKLNADKDVTAVIIQHPLPNGINHSKIVSALLPEKDAEGVHPYNLGRIFRREADIVPCTPGAVMKILRMANIDLYGRDVVIVGHSDIVGKPLSLMLLNETATTSVCHLGTAEKGDIKAYTKKADILIVAVGKAGMVKRDWIKEGAVVIDVGINSVSGEIKGDVDLPSVADKVSFITPVPGGVGPVTVSILMRNVLRAYERQNTIV